MNWPTLLAPGWGWMGLLAVPLIALYLLRQKRPNQEVSSTLLWSRTLADMRASTPFQKLRRNLLLLLQLLILAALVLTLMRPVVQAQVGQTRAGVIVIDATASMQARDGGAGGADGQMRLERAKEEARKLVESMRPGDRFKVIADGGGLNRIGNDFMTSKSDLLSVINGIHASDTPSDLSESLLLAAESLRAINAGAKENAVVAGKIWLLSDGAGVRLPDTFGDAGGMLQFIKIGASDRSVGVTRLSITPDAKEPRTYQVFVGLKNAWPVEKRVAVLLAWGTKDAFLPGQAQFVTLPPRDQAGGQGGTVFEKVAADPGKLYVRVDETGDDFPLDNTAYGILAPPRKVRVMLVTAGNQVLERFMQTAVSVGKIEGQVVAPGEFKPGMQADLFIFDGFLPAWLPKADTLLVRPQVAGAGEVAGFKVAGMLDKPAVLRWKREDPLMQSAELGDLVVGAALRLEPDPSAVELVSSPEGPLIAYKDFGAVRRYLVGFGPMMESNWWHLTSLLIFLQNVVDQTQARHYIGMAQLVSSGSPAKLWDVGDETGGGEARVTMPDGSVAKVAVKDGAAEFAATDQAGFYEVESGGKKSLFAVNLLSASESDIGPRSLQSAGGSNVEEATSVATINKEIWRWVAAGALAVLLVEWWVYHRRIA